MSFKSFCLKVCSIFACKGEQSTIEQAPAVEHILTILVSVHKPVVRDRLKFKNRPVKMSK